MIHLKWLGTGVLVLGLEFGLFWLIFKVHYGPQVFLTLMALGGSYLMGMAIHRGK